MSENSDQINTRFNATVNINCIIRLLHYKNAVQRLKKLGFVKVFSDNLGDATSVSSTQVRKDFSQFGITGNKKGGYFIDSLLVQLNTILGKEDQQKVIVVGAGKIGTALMDYRGFGQEGFNVVAAFDIRPIPAATTGAVPVFPMERLSDFVREHGVRLGIISVPIDAAQNAYEAMASAGIRGILNFAPVHLKATPLISISNVNIAMELEKLWYCVRMLA